MKDSTKDLILYIASAIVFALAIIFLFGCSTIKTSYCALQCDCENLVVHSKCDIPDREYAIGYCNEKCNPKEPE